MKFNFNAHIAARSFDPAGDEISEVARAFARLNASCQTLLENVPAVCALANNFTAGEFDRRSTDLAFLAELVRRSQAGHGEIPENAAALPQPVEG